MKRTVAIVVSLAMIFSMVGTTTTAVATDTTSKTTDSTANEISVDDSACVKGEALVTLTLPEGVDSPLIHEGFLKNDPRIRVKNVMNFGDATELGRTASQQDSLSKKQMIVSHVSSSAYDTEELVTALKGYANVTEVSPNHRIKQAAVNDPLYPEQWSLREGESDQASNSGAIGFTPESGSVSDKNAPVVAVLDTGIDFSHEDLADRMWVNTTTELKGKHGYDFVNDDTNPTPTNIIDDHGTNIAGIIAATTDNAKGIAGISQHAKLMDLKVFDTDNYDNSGTEATIIAAFEYLYKAATLGVNVVAVNCSFGYPPSNTPYTDLSEEMKTEEAIMMKLGTVGAITVYSAGNDNVEITEKSYGQPHQFDQTYCMIVGSVDRDGQKSAFSNYGKNKVALMAPGEEILTTTITDTFLPETYDTDKRNKLCRFYDTFDTQDSTLLSYSDLFPQDKSTISISHSKADFHNDSGSGSAEIAIKRSRTPSPYAYTVFYDVTSYNLNIQKDVYISMMVTSDGSWQHKTESLKKCTYLGLYSANDHTYLAIDLKKCFSGIFQSMIGGSIFIDDLALSTDDPDTKDFGRYDIITGTSFSTPHVAGAIARLAALFPKDNSLTRKEKLLSCVKKSDALKEFCISSGMLDMTGFADTGSIHKKDIIYKVKKIKLNRTKTTLKAGKKLKLKATVTPDYATNQKLKWTVNKPAFLSVTQKGVVKAKKKGRGHTVTVTVTAKDGSKKKATCKIKIKK